MSVQMTKPTRPPKDGRIEIRAQTDDVVLIDAAAESLGMDRTSFILDAALSQARTIMGEDYSVNLSPEGMEWLLDYLDNPPADNPGLRELFERAERLQGS